MKLLILMLYSFYIGEGSIDLVFVKSGYDDMTSAPYATSQLPHKGSCMFKCFNKHTPPRCVRFNYRLDTKECSIFLYHTPISFTPSINHFNFISYQIKPDCMNGGKYIPLINQCLVVPQERNNWEESRLLCNSMGYHALVIDSVLKYNQFYTYILSEMTKPFVFQNCRMLAWDFRGFWTAAQRLEPWPNSTFYWKPYLNVSFAPVDYWFPGEPNNFGGFEGCGLFGVEDSHMYDFSCTTTSCVVCEGSLLDFVHYLI